MEPIQGLIIAGQPERARRALKLGSCERRCAACISMRRASGRGAKPFHCLAASSWNSCAVSRIQARLETQSGFRLCCSSRSWRRRRHFVAEAALAAPRNGVAEIAGPERAPLNEIVARYLKAVGDPRQVVGDPEAGYGGGRVDESSLVPLGEARLGRIGLDEWLRRSRPAT
jgi:hypothetical protein